MQGIDGDYIEQEKLGSLPRKVRAKTLEYMTALPIKAVKYLAGNGLGKIQSRVRFDKVVGLLHFFNDNMRSDPGTLFMS